jgi:hypothetical protein
MNILEDFLKLQDLDEDQTFAFEHEAVGYEAKYSYCHDTYLVRRASDGEILEESSHFQRLQKAVSSRFSVKEPV